VVSVCQYLLRCVSRDGEQDVHILTVKVTNFGCAISRVVIHFLPTIAAGVQFQIRSYGIVVHKMVLKWVFTEISVSLASSHSTNCSSFIIIVNDAVHC
jgi:hypothetical protein